MSTAPTPSPSPAAADALPPPARIHMAHLPASVADEEFAAIAATHADNPPARDQLVGLALSGGGIRSATFALGVLEALKKADLLKRIHYLSTVSGGGYIGGWFSASCKRAVDRRRNSARAAKTGDAAKGPAPLEPFWWEQRADWGTSIAHLRRYSNYLSPQVGFFSADTWSMFTVWLRNALLMQWTVIMAMACVLLLPRLLPRWFATWYDVHNWRWLGVLTFVVAVIGIAGNQQWVSRGKPAWLTQTKHWPAGLAVAAACLILGVVYASISGFDPFGPGPVDPTTAAIEAFLVVLGGYATLPLLVGAYGLVTRTKAPQLNYTQNHVQWFIVLPLLNSSP
jgi:predicted acylesterase/phospholipase RssA